MASGSTDRPLPGQRQPREFVAQHQRSRIITALAREVSEKGFHAVTVAGVVSRAGVARNAFYENFASKEDCFLAAQEHAMSIALERVVDAAGRLESWPRRVSAGLTAFVAYVGEEPTLARTCMVEALAAGPAAAGYYEESQQAFVSLFRLGRDVSPHREELPETLEEAIIGGVFWLVYQRLVAGEPDAIEDLLPELIEFALTPYLGADAAREAASASDDEKLKPRPSRQIG